MIDALISKPFFQRWQRKYFHPFVSFIIVIGALFLAIAASFVSSLTLSIILIVLPIGIGIVLILLRYPSLGILAIIPSSFIIPVEIGVSSGSSLNAPMILIILMTGLWLVDMFVIQRQFLFSRSGSILPIGLLTVVVLLAFLNGQLPWFILARQAPITAQIGGVALFLLSASVFLVSAHQITNIIWLKAMTWLYLGMGLLFFLTQIIPGIQNYSLRIFHYGSLTSLFWTWMVALSLGQAVYNKHLPIWQRIGLGIISLITLYFAYTLIDGWKSGWVPALAVIFTLIFLRSPKSALIIVICAILVSPIFLINLISTDQYSFDTRIEAWLLIGKIIKESPILGLGPANYYWYTPLFPIRGYAVQYNSHNQFIDIIAQIGLLGLFAFIWVMAAIGNLGLRLSKFVPEGFAKGYVYSALAGIVGMLTAAMLGDWIFPFVYNVGFTGFRSSLFGWLFLGGLVALEKMVEVKHS